MTKDCYTFVVRFTRSLSEDLEVINAPDATRIDEALAQKLMQQFRKELQDCFDSREVGPAGSFLIEAVQMDGLSLTFNASKEKT